MAAARSIGRHGERDAGLIWICYSHALRVSELIAMKWESVSFTTGKLLVDRRYSGGLAEHEMSLEDIEVLRALAALPKYSDYIFCSERGKAMRVRVVHTIIARAGRVAGLGHAVNSQMLRDSRGLALVNEGLKSSEIQAFFGNKRTQKVAAYRACSQQLKEGTGRLVDTELSTSFAEDFPIDHDKIDRSITLVIPASTCNLGPGLDTLGLALSLYTRITVWLLKKNYAAVPRVVLRGVMADRSEASDQGDLIYTMLTKLWKSTPRDASRLRVLVHSDIPLGSGLGGTGTVVLGALWASHVLRDFIPTRAKILAEATALEHHPESLAPSLMGNLMICGMADGETVLTEQIQWPQQWHTIVLTPSYRLTTPKARAVLPKQVKLADAIFNIQRTSLVVAAIQNQNESTMKLALEDRLHEHYRVRLVPELSEIRAVLAKEPVIGCVLSGAGSSVLVIVNHKKKEAVLSRLKQWIALDKKALTLLDLAVDPTGLREIDSE